MPRQNSHEFTLTDIPEKHIGRLPAAIAVAKENPGKAVVVGSANIGGGASKRVVHAEGLECRIVNKQFLIWQPL